MAFAWGRERTQLLIFPEDRVPEWVGRRFDELLDRRARRTPVAYLTGEKEFMSLPFYVNSDVLIPRPETELIVEEVLHFLAEREREGRGDGLRLPGADDVSNEAGCMPPAKNTGDGDMHMPAGDKSPGPLVADVGTGCGVIAVSLAYYNPWARLLASDISPRALRVARRNAVRHGVAARVDLLQGDLLSPLLRPGMSGRGTAVAANLPYIPTAALRSLPADVRCEPLSALDGGEDGLDHYRRLLPQAAAFLAPQGLLACEVGMEQAEPLAEILTKEGWTKTEIIKDYAGRERIVAAKRK